MKKICLAFLVLNLAVWVKSQSHLTPEDFELAKAIDFKALQSQYLAENKSITLAPSGRVGDDLDTHPKAVWAIWPGGLIPYTIEPGFSANDRAGIANAIAYLESNTCLRFKPHGGGSTNPKMTFAPVNQNGYCFTQWSTDGKTNTWAKVSLSPNSACTFGRTILHEIVHGLAGFHTHKRFDRDAHVQVVYENVLPDKKSEFDICKGGCCCQTWGYPYDCDSIMHYAKNQMSINGKDTLVSNSASCKLLDFSSWQVYNPYMSPFDIEFIQEQYGQFC